MELNTKGRYAVMAMADLAAQAAKQTTSEAGEQVGGHATPLSDIADRQQISLAYLEQLFLRLRKAGLIESLRGRTGGYTLGRPARTIAIASILAAVEEPVKMTRCQGGEDGCVGHDRCLTHDLWTALGDHIAVFLEGVTLQDVLDGMPSHHAPSRGLSGDTVRAATAFGGIRT